MEYIAIFIIIIIGLFIISRHYAGQFLIINQQPEKADVIIVLSGPPDDLKLRIDHAHKLYNLCYAPYLIFSGEIGICKSMKDNAIKEGIPREAILIEDKSFSTYENAIHTRDKMISHGFKSAIIVSSDYHMRRTKFLFDNIYSGTGISLCYCTTKSPYFNPQKWWDNKQSAEVTINEYLKLIANALGIYSQDNNDKAILNNFNKYLFR